LHKDDKRNLGKSLSGFSNAIGGVVVWGVATSPKPDEEAVAARLVPIREIDALSRERLIPVAPV
jgi:hypothetical protein